MQRALILALHTGQRKGDLLRLPWSAYEGTTIRLRQGKTKRKVTIPAAMALRQMLDGMERVSPIVLTTTTGRPFKKRYFLHSWTRVMKRAGLTRLHFHDLRGTTVTPLAEPGATGEQVAASTGHTFETVRNILGKYLARTEGLAQEAISRFENSNRTNFVNRLETSVGARTKANKEK